MRRSKSSRCLALALASTLAASVMALPASAEPTASDNETARQLLREGIQLRNSGDVAAAVEKLKGAHALARTPVTGLELGKTYLLALKLVEARDVFREVVRLPEDRETDRTRAARAEAETKADELTARIPSIRLVLSGAPDPARMAVLVDDEKVPLVALSAPRKVNPGKHTIVIQIDGAPQASLPVTLGEGETREVPLAIPTLPPLPLSSSAPAPGPSSPARPAPEQPFWSGQRIGGAVASGAGIVGIGVGAVSGVMALSKNSQSNADGHCHGVNLCDSTGFALRTDARTAGVVSTAAWVVGGVALVGGVVLFATAKSARSTEVVAGPQGMWVRGTW